MFVGIGGALLTLIAAIFLNGDASMLRMMGTGAFFGSGSLIYIVLNPIYGFIIVVVTRAAAETFRALAAIANNTKKADRALHARAVLSTARTIFDGRNTKSDGRIFVARSCICNSELTLKN